MPSRIELVSVLDETGTALQISEEHALLLGYTAAELVGKCVFDFVHPADIDYVRETFRCLVRSNEEVTVSFRFRHKRGKWVTFRSRGVPLFDEGRLKGFVVVSNEHRNVDLKALIQKIDFIPVLAEGS